MQTSWDTVLVPCHGDHHERWILIERRVHHLSPLDLRLGQELIDLPHKLIPSRFTRQDDVVATF